MAGNDDLHPILSKIHKTLGDVLKSIKEVKGEITKVHTAITEGVDTLRDAIHENIQAQAELKMMERLVEVRSILPQIEAEQDRIEIEQEELDKQLERIAERYEKKHDELDEKAAKRIRDLGSHIFEIDEGEFEDGIEDPFVEHVTGIWPTLQSQNDMVKKGRREQIESTTEEVVAEIRDFVNQQQELHDRIQRVRTDIGRSVSKPTTVQVPYYVVTVESEGEVERHLIPPSKLQETDGYYDLQSFSGVEEIVSPTDINQPQTEFIESGTVRREIDTYVDDNKPVISYGEAVEETLPDRVEISVEGGE